MDQLHGVVEELKRVQNALNAAAIVGNMEASAEANADGRVTADRLAETLLLAAGVTPTQIAQLQAERQAERLQEDAANDAAAAGNGADE